MAIFQRNGEWYIDYYVYGRRKREKVGPSKKLAQDVFRKRKVQIAENKFLDIKKEQKIIFNDFSKIYFENHSKPNHKISRSRDLVSLKRLNASFGSRYLHEISTAMVESYKNQRREEVSPATVNRELACLKSLFNKAILWGNVYENPVRSVKLYKENNARVRYLEKEEISKVLEHCSPVLHAIVTIALNTGMRKSEIQNLNWNDVQFKGGYIVLKHTKNDEARIIPMNRTVREVLFKLEKKSDSQYIFCGKNGKPFNFRKAFENAIIKSGINDFRFHDLRHTFASHLVMKGVDLNTVRDLLGHKSLNMTLRYSHLSRDHKRRAVEVLDIKMDTIWTPKPMIEKVTKDDNIVSLLAISTN